MPPDKERMNQGMDDDYIRAYEANRRSDLVEWLNRLFPELRLPLDIAVVELTELLLDGSLLCGIIGKIDVHLKYQFGNESTPDKDNENIRWFLSAISEMGLPTFNASDLKQGLISAVVECLLCLRDHVNLENGKCFAQSMDSSIDGGSLSMKRWEILNNDRLEIKESEGEGCVSNGDSSPIAEDEGKKNIMESKFQITSEASTAPFHHVEDNFHKVFKQETDFPASKISEIMTSNNLDSVSAHSLMNVVNGILDKCTEKINGEVPHHVAFMVRNLMLEIERRLSSQGLHIHNLNNLIKSREEKYQSRIKVLGVVADGMSEEIQMAKDQFQQMKSDKLEIEDRKKEKEQDIARLIKEKEDCDTEMAKLKKEMKLNIEIYEKKCLELETRSEEAKLDMVERMKKVDNCLAESKKRIQELESFLEFKDLKWKRKEHIYQNFIGVQLQWLEDLRVLSGSIEKEMANTHKMWETEFPLLGKKLKSITDAAENYHAVLAENRRLYNEVQDLKGNIRVYCRIRPFLPGQNRKLASIDFTWEDGELLIRNPSKQGKDSHRVFKFNKVFGPAVSQEEVFRDTQPLIRSVLDGYNVCIFAYGQTGSGKTYTMSGPSGSSKQDWGVNYRALNDLFYMSQTRRNTFLYEVGVQMVEIYNEQVRDLLSNNGSTKRFGIWSTSQPNGLAVPDASMHSVRSTSDVLELMHVGQMNRAVGATALNERSSRSHSILTVHVRGVDLESGDTLRGCLHLVDLAGSERVDRTEATGDRLKEAQHINKSLSALGDVIYALAQKSPHVPYRNSKLTQVLQSSLGGQAKTLMFVQINPDIESYLESISTLKFAERVSGVELGAARSNKEGKDIRSLMEQVASLKDAVAKKDEEIECLQLKDRKSYSTQSSNNHIIKSPRKLFSPDRPSLRNSAQRGRRSMTRTSTTLLTQKAASDPEVRSEYSDKHSESGSLQSVDDSKQQKETCFQEKPVFTDCQDIELLGFGAGDSEERLSDISDGGLSMGTETDGSINSVVEHILFPEVENCNEDSQDKMTEVPSKVPRASAEKLSRQGLPKSELKGTPSGSRKAFSGQKAISARQSKRWQ